MKRNPDSRHRYHRPRKRRVCPWAALHQDFFARWGDTSAAGPTGKFWATADGPQGFQQQMFLTYFNGYSSVFQKIILSLVFFYILGWSYWLVQFRPIYPEVSLFSALSRSSWHPKAWHNKIRGTHEEDALLPQSFDHHLHRIPQGLCKCCDRTLAGRQDLRGGKKFEVVERKVYETRWSNRQPISSLLGFVYLRWFFIFHIFHF